MYAENFPLVQQGRQEEAGQFSFGSFDALPGLPSLKNYAAHEESRRYVEQELAPLIEQVRQDRSELEAEWREIRAMNHMVHGANRRYFGRSDYYLPVYRRERGKLISALSRGLFPSDDYFDCVDEGTGDPESAKPVKAYMGWELERNARLRSFMKPWLGNMIDYGMAIMKVWYKKQLGVQGNALKNMLAGSNMSTQAFGFMPRSREGMAVSNRSPYYFYVYPVTAETLDDCLMLFEDIDVNESFVKTMGRKGRWENLEEAMARAVPTHDTNRDSIVSEQGLGTPPTGFGSFSELFTVTEIWTCMLLPSNAYLPWEDTEEALPVRIVTIGGTPVEITRNPAFHQRPPYVVARMDQVDGLFYGSAAGRTIKPLQLLANDFSNQTNDNGILALNPMTLVNPSLLAGPLRPFAPGVPLFVSDVDKAIRFDRPPTDQVQMGLMMLQQIIGMGQDSGGAPPDRAVMSKGAKTATGMQILQRNAVGPLQDVVEDIEIDAMVQLLWLGWKNAVQYRDQRVMVRVTGEELMRAIDPEMLAIEAQFSWKASSQAVNNQQRSQQALGLIQAISPLLPVIMQQGYIVDFVPLLRKVYSDGMGFRGFNEFIKKAQAPGAGPMQPGMTPQVAAEQGDNARSALSQVYGGASPEAEPAPGEAEDFGEVRAEADDMAAAMGGMGGL